MQFRCEGAVTRWAKTHLKFALTSRYVVSVPAYRILKAQISVLSETQQSFSEHNNLLQDTTFISKTQRSIAIHKSNQNKVSRNTTTTTNKQSNDLLPWIPVISKWWRTAYSVDITSNNWPNKSSKFRFLCIRLATLVRLCWLRANQRRWSRQHNPIGHWSGLSFTGKKLGSLSKHDVDGSEHVISKCNFALLQYFFNYSKSLCLKNVF